MERYEQKNNINDCFEEEWMEDRKSRRKKLKMFDDVRGGYKRTKDWAWNKNSRRQQWCLGSCTGPGN